MRKYLMILIAFSMSVGLFAQQRVGNVVKVQGHVHELLTKQAMEGRLKTAPVKKQVVFGTTDTIIPTNVHCFAGCPNTTYPVDTAYLVVKWTDGKQDENILIWGYRWNNANAFGPVTKYTVDMIRAVANTVPAFSVLLQQTSSDTGYSVGGFGYNYSGCARVPLIFQLDSAIANVNFAYTTPLNCVTNGQLVVPVNPSSLAEQAIAVANNTGIIEHPFNVNYGYPAYDYDYWILETDMPFYSWQSGWTKGYWSFYSKDSLIGSFTISNLGISSRVLSKNSVDGFVFNTDPSVWPPIVDMSGDYTGFNCCQE